MVKEGRAKDADPGGMIEAAYLLINHLGCKNMRFEDVWTTDTRNLMGIRHDDGYQKRINRNISYNT